MSGEVETYYDRPALKPSLYGWRVALYMFVGGMAGAAQILATVADLLGVQGGAHVILTGRALALAGAILGGVLLILDLHTKQRFYNMLRIFRATSPMSIGTYVLLGFGFFSLVALIAGLRDAHALAMACGVLASIAGWGMTAYTAALLATTSTPLWAASPRALGLGFASSSMATGAAVLNLSQWASGHLGIATALARVAMVALAVGLAASILAGRSFRSAGVGAALAELPWGAVNAVGVQLLGALVPIALYLAEEAAPSAAGVLSPIASLLVLAGGMLMRATVLLSGNESARRPAEYFRLARGNGAPHAGPGASRG